VRFVDTSVLVHAVSTDPADAPNAERARALLRERDLALSVQVLQEFHVQATRPAIGLTHDEATALIATFERFPVQENTLALLHAALAARQRWGLSYRDAQIVEAARLLGCSRVLSETLPHGRAFGGLRVENPFS
jgi:predicted nucleic acid-binding protein